MPVRWKTRSDPVGGCDRAHHVAARTESLAQAATSGFGRALFVGSLIVLSATVVALLTPNGRQSATAVEEQPALDLAA